MRWNGENLKRIRESLCVTQGALGVASGLDEIDVRRLENGNFRRGPGSDMAARVVDGLNALVRKANAADPMGHQRRPVELADLHDQDDADVARFGDRKPWLTVSRDGRVEEV